MKSTATSLGKDYQTCPQPFAASVLTMTSLPAVFVPKGGLPVDHLTLPRNPKYIPPPWPFLCEDEEYDGGDFLTYPARMGWTDTDMDPNTCKRSSQEIAKYFQNWFDGHVPVVHVDNGARFLRASKGVPYVAISHVWSDGCGNPKANTLPSCQISRISNLVNNIYASSTESLPFWMDTLCCPVNTEPFQARSAAINMMKRTYEEAAVVLVLDEYLESQSVSTLPGEEILMMIHCSK